MRRVTAAAARSSAHAADVRVRPRSQLVRHDSPRSAPGPRRERVRLHLVSGQDGAVAHGQICLAWLSRRDCGRWPPPAHLYLVRRGVPAEPGPRGLPALGELAQRLGPCRPGSAGRRWAVAADPAAGLHRRACRPRGKSRLVRACPRRPGRRSSKSSGRPVRPSDQVPDALAAALAGCPTCPDRRSACSAGRTVAAREGAVGSRSETARHPGSADRSSACRPYPTRWSRSSGARVVLAAIRPPGPGGCSPTTRPDEVWAGRCRRARMSTPTQARRRPGLDGIAGRPRAPARRAGSGSARGPR